MGWHQVCLTNDAVRGWTNRPYLDALVLTNAAIPESFWLGKTVILEGRMSMTDTGWTQLASYAYVPGTNISFHTLGNQFFRARTVLP